MSVWGVKLEVALQKILWVVVLFATVLLSIVLFFLGGWVVSVCVAVAVLGTSACALGFARLQPLLIALVFLTNLFLLRRFDKLITYIGGGIVFKISFFVATGTLVIFALKLLAVGATRRHHNLAGNQHTTIPFKWFVLLLCTILISTLINAQEGARLSDSMYATAQFLIPMLYAFVLPGVLRDRREIGLLIRLIVFCAFLVSVTVIFFSFNERLLATLLKWRGPLYTGGSQSIARTFMPFGSATGVSAVLVLTLPLVYFDYITEVRGRTATFLFITTGLTAIAIILCLSRASLLALLMMLIGIVLEKKARRPWRKYLVVLALIVVGGYMLLTIDLSRYGRISSNARLRSWRTALLIWYDNPFLGVAPNTVYRRLGTTWLELSRFDFPYQKLDFISTRYKGHWTLWDPHSVYLTLLAETGLIGLCLFAIICSSIVKILQRSRFLKEGTSKEFNLLRGFLWGISLFLLDCVFYGNLVMNYKIAFFFWIYVGIGLALATNLALRTSPSVRLEHTSARPLPVGSSPRARRVP